jgi:hypothetical protein
MVREHVTNLTDKHVQGADNATGQPASHDEAKKLMAGFAGAFVDREVEPRAENAYDRERIQRDASQQVQPMLDQQYGGGGGGGGGGQQYGDDQGYGGGGGGGQQYGDDQGYGGGRGDQGYGGGNQQNY